MDARAADSVFLNDVLPYAVVDEVRDSWRPDFYARFARRAAGAADVRAAIDSINRHIAADVAVEYNTPREKTNQSPSESMRQHMASCTGLSVLLVDALRSAGIPARFAGLRMARRSGQPQLGRGVDRRPLAFHGVLFSGKTRLRMVFCRCGTGVARRPGSRHFRRFVPAAGDWFPMVWSEDSREVHGVNVTQRYRDLYAAYADDLAERGRHATVTS